MEPLLMILVPGLLGGLVLALLIAGDRRRAPSIVVPTRLAAPSPALINMAHIRVEGVGGLGMVGAVVVVAISDPRIGLATILASVLGIGLAFVLIAMRRHTGGLPSGGDGPDYRSTLGIDDDRRRTRSPLPERLEHNSGMRIPATLGLGRASYVQVRLNSVQSLVLTHGRDITPEGFY